MVFRIFVGIVESFSLEPEVRITGSIGRGSELPSHLSNEIQGPCDDNTTLHSCSICGITKGILSLLKRCGVDVERVTRSGGHGFGIDGSGVSGSRGIYLSNKTFEWRDKIPHVSLTPGAKDEMPLDGRKLILER